MHNRSVSPVYDQRMASVLSVWLARIVRQDVCIRCRYFRHTLEVRYSCDIHTLAVRYIFPTHVPAYVSVWPAYST